MIPLLMRVEECNGRGRRATYTRVLCCAGCRGRCVKCRRVKPVSPARRDELRGLVGIPVLAAAIRGLVITDPATHWS